MSVLLYLSNQFDKILCIFVGGMPSDGTTKCGPLGACSSISVLMESVTAVVVDPQQQSQQ